MTPLKAGKLKNAYACSEIDLYDVLNLGLNAFLEYQPQFQAVVTTFTVEWEEQQRDALLAAKALPDAEIRGDMHEELRIRLILSGDESCIQWKYLESYIKRAFPISEHKVQLEEAGKLFYRKASRHDWGQVETLLARASAYMDTHSAVLLTAGMPVAFPDNFATLEIDFNSKYTAFADIEQQVTQMREAKIRANNAIFNEINEMFKVGQKIFRNDEAIRRRFTFSKILQYVYQQRSSLVQRILKLIVSLLVPNTLELGIRGKGKLNIIYGDGFKELFTMNSDATNFSNHIYQLIRKNITVKISGDVSGITEFHCNNSRLLSFGILKDMKNLVMLILQNNMLDEDEVNKILITLDKMGMSGITINLLGNAAPTGDGIIAKNNLIGRGCTVLTS